MIKPSSSKPGIRGAAEVPSLLYELRHHKAPQGIWPGFLGRWGDDSLGDSSREFCAGHAGYCFSWERDSPNPWEAPRGYQKVTCWKQLHATSSRKIARIRLGQPINEASLPLHASLLVWCHGCIWCLCARIPWNMSQFHRDLPHQPGNTWRVVRPDSTSWVAVGAR